MVIFPLGSETESQTKQSFLGPCSRYSPPGTQKEPEGAPSCFPQLSRTQIIPSSPRIREQPGGAPLCCPQLPRPQTMGHPEAQGYSPRVCWNPVPLRVYWAGELGSRPGRKAEQLGRGKQSVVCLSFCLPPSLISSSKVGMIPSQILAFWNSLMNVSRAAFSKYTILSKVKLFLWQTQAPPWLNTHSLSFSMVGGPLKKIKRSSLPTSQVKSRRLPPVSQECVLHFKWLRGKSKEGCFMMHGNDLRFKFQCP